MIMWFIFLGGFYLILLSRAPSHVMFIVRPFLQKMKRKASKSLRERLAKKAKKNKGLVKKTVSKTSGRVQVSMSQIKYHQIHKFINQL